LHGQQQIVFSQFKGGPLHLDIVNGIYTTITYSWATHNIESFCHLGTLQNWAQDKHSYPPIGSHALFTCYLEIISWWGAISLYHSFGDISNTTAPFCWRLHKTKEILWKSTVCNVNPQATYAMQSEWVAQSWCIIQLKLKLKPS